MKIACVLVLCIASAIVGRLVLTREEARRTITVRLPALLMLFLTAVLSITFWIFWGVLCFIGGSFYGLGQWWWPKLFAVLEFNGECLSPIISGEWE